MRYFEILEKFESTKVALSSLDHEYKDKKKGDAYLKRKMQLVNRLDDLKKKALGIGTTGNICHVHGKRSRASRKNPTLLVQESFNLYFINISMEEATALTNLHIKNIVYHTVRFIRPGVLITSS